MWTGRRKTQQHTTNADAGSSPVANKAARCSTSTPSGQVNVALPNLKHEVEDLLRAQPSTRPGVALQPFSYWEQLKAEREGSTVPEPVDLETSAFTHRLIPPMIPYLPATGLNEGDEFTGFRFPLSPDHQLIVLVQFNTLRAVLTNLSILSLQHIMPAECGAVFNIACLPEAPSTIPPSLECTALQRSIPHDPWIDMIPFPAMRDNVLLSGDEFDQDEFCLDASGGLFEGFDETETRGIIIWGEPWSPSGWEVSEGFVKRWGFLLRGCDELIEATQRYREARGEERLVIEL